MLSLIGTNQQTLRELIRLAVPVIISQGAFAIMIFTDRYFMSQISPTHMAASLGGGVAFYFCISLFTGILSYGNAIVAQHFGSRDYEKCSRVFTQGLVLSFACLPALLVVGAGISFLFEAIGHEPTQAELARHYFLILLWGSLISLVKTAIAAYFSGIGRTRVVMIADTLGVLLNIPLSYALVFGVWGAPELGITGAGIGTLISNIFALGIFVFFYMEKNHFRRFYVGNSWVFDKGITRRYFRLGLPSGIETFLNVAAFNLFLLLFQSYGVAEGAAAAIVFNWDILCFVPLMGLNIAIISLSGRIVGEGNSAKLNEVMASGFILGLGYSCILALIFFSFRGPLVEVFITPGVDYQAIRELATYMMIGLATYAMADATILVSSGVLRGAGDTQWIMKASVLLHWAMLAAQFIVIKVFGVGPKFSWLVFVSMIMIIAIVFVIRLRSNHWRDEQTLHRMLSES